MTERSSTPPEQLIRRLRSASVVMGCLPEQPGYNGSLLTIDDVEASKVASDIDAAVKVLANYGLLRQLVLDCQSDLAIYLPPDSGISAHDVVSTLLGRLDGPQSRAALAEVK